MSIWAVILHILPPAKYWDISQQLGVSGSWSIHANSSVIYCLSTISIPDDGIVFEKCFVFQAPFLGVCSLVGIGGLGLLLPGAFRRAPTQGNMGSKGRSCPWGACLRTRIGTELVLAVVMPNRSAWSGWATRVFARVLAWIASTVLREDSPH